jgi:PAS domain S-box-containing protein
MTKHYSEEDIEQLEQELAALRLEVSLLRNEEQVFQQIVSASPEPIWIQVGGRIIYANPAAGHMLGCAPEQLIGQWMQSLVAEGFEALVQQKVHTLTHERVPIELIELQFVRSDDAIIDVEARGTPIRYFDKEANLILLRDITERKRAERERETLIEELNAFAHTVAHDIKHPLSLIVGLATFLEEEYTTIDNNTMDEIIYAMVQHGYALTNLVDELLLLAQVRQDDITFERVDMGRVVESMLYQVEHQIRGHDAQVTVMEGWPACIGYPSWLKQVWINYVSNAIKYGGEPPVIKIGYTREGNGYVTYWVQDHGDGLTEQQQKRLFQEFSQVGQDRSKGHGLGLSIVKRIIERLNGQVGVDSIPGKGSRFWFQLIEATEQEWEK